MKLRNGRHQGSKNLVEERQLLKKINQVRGEVEMNQVRGEVEMISVSRPTEPATTNYTWRGNILDTKKALMEYIKVAERNLIICYSEYL